MSGWKNDCSAGEYGIGAAPRESGKRKGYLNCHTDITIPYDELDKITVIRKDGTTEDIIADGRFVLAGTEALNEPLDR